MIPIILIVLCLLSVISFSPSINGCGTISTAGYYELTGDINGTVLNSHCINIQTSNVEIDGKGYTFTCIPQSTSYYCIQPNNNNNILIHSMKVNFTNTTFSSTSSTVTFMRYGMNTQIVKNLSVTAQTNCKARIFYGGTSSAGNYNLNDTIINMTTSQGNAINSAAAGQWKVYNLTVYSNAGGSEYILYLQTKFYGENITVMNYGPGGRNLYSTSSNSMVFKNYNSTAINVGIGTDFIQSANILYDNCYLSSSSTPLFIRGTNVNNATFNNCLIQSTGNNYPIQIDSGARGVTIKNSITRSLYVDNAVNLTIFNVTFNTDIPGANFFYFRNVNTSVFANNTFVKRLSTTITPFDLIDNSRIENNVINLSSSTNLTFSSRGKNNTIKNNVIDQAGSAVFFFGSIDHTLNKELLVENNTFISSTSNYFIHNVSNSTFRNNFFLGNKNLYIRYSSDLITEDNNITNSLFLLYTNSSTFSKNKIKYYSGTVSHVLNIDPSSNNNVFTENVLISNNWVNNTNSNNQFNLSGKGNRYINLSGEEAWTVFDIIDTDSDNYADTGSDLPFNNALLGNRWLGSGDDWHPYTENTGGGCYYTSVNTSPWYWNNTYAGKSTSFSVNISDNDGITNYRFWFYNGNNWNVDPWVSNGGGNTVAFQTSKTLTSVVSSLINFTVEVNDTCGNYVNISFGYFYTDQEPYVCSYPSINVTPWYWNSTLAGNQTLFNISVNDNDNITAVKFWFNNGSGFIGDNWIDIEDSPNYNFSVVKTLNTTINTTINFTLTVKDICNNEQNVSYDWFNTTKVCYGQLNNLTPWSWNTTGMYQSVKLDIQLYDESSINEYRLVFRNGTNSGWLYLPWSSHGQQTLNFEEIVNLPGVGEEVAFYVETRDSCNNTKISVTGTFNTTYICSANSYNSTPWNWSNEYAGEETVLTVNVTNADNLTAHRLWVKNGSEDWKAFDWYYYQPSNEMVVNHSFNNTNEVGANVWFFVETIDSCGQNSNTSAYYYTTLYRCKYASYNITPWSWNSTYADEDANLSVEVADNDNITAVKFWFYNSSEWIADDWLNVTPNITYYFSTIKTMPNTVGNRVNFTLTVRDICLNDANITQGSFVLTKHCVFDSRNVTPFSWNTTNAGESVNISVRIRDSDVIQAYRFWLKIGDNDWTSTDWTAANTTETNTSTAFVLPGINKVINFTVEISDYCFNIMNTSYDYFITTGDNITITILSPINTTYYYSFPLEYVYDSYNPVVSCKYNLNDGQNYTLVNCENLTIYPDNYGSYYLNLYISDAYSEYKRVSEVFTVYPLSEINVTNLSYSNLTTNITFYGQINSMNNLSKYEVLLKVCAYDYEKIHEDNISDTSYFVNVTKDFSTIGFIFSCINYYKICAYDIYDAYNCSASYAIDLRDFGTGGSGGESYMDIGFSLLALILLSIYLHRYVLEGWFKAVFTILMISLVMITVILLASTSNVLGMYGITNILLTWFNLFILLLGVALLFLQLYIVLKTLSFIYQPLKHIVNSLEKYFVTLKFFDKQEKK